MTFNEVNKPPPWRISVASRISSYGFFLGKSTLHRAGSREGRMLPDRVI
jgi:hypothetical protein